MIHCSWNGTMTGHSSYVSISYHDYKNQLGLIKPGSPYHNSQCLMSRSDFKHLILHLRVVHRSKL